MKPLQRSSTESSSSRHATLERTAIDVDELVPGVVPLVAHGNTAGQSRLNGRRSCLLVPSLSAVIVLESQS